jgi:hypothetical protein
MRHGWLLIGPVLCLGLLQAGCPRSQGSVETNNVSHASPMNVPPVPVIPEDSPLVEHAELKLGMDQLTISQVYNAPEGVGDGFTRVLEPYAAVVHHIIRFDLNEGEPERRIVASFYHDRLYLIVDRRDGLTGEQAAAWFAECVERYGEEHRETVAGAQWVWEGDSGEMVTFTQDNASEKNMSANLVVEHVPTRGAAHTYLEQWAAANPHHEYPR